MLLEFEDQERFVFVAEGECGGCYTNLGAFFQDGQIAALGVHVGFRALNVRELKIGGGELEKHFFIGRIADGVIGGVGVAGGLAFERAGFRVEG